MAPAADVLDEAKSRVAQAVDCLADDLERLSHRIHANPELAFKEDKAAGWLAEFLDKQGALPTIHPYVRISPDGIPGHSREFAEWAKSPMARTGLLAAAKALAMTALDLVARPAELQKAREEFARTQG